MIFLYLLSGFVLGFIITLTGVGGGVLVIPTLGFFFNFPPSIAVGTASLYTTLTKTFALIKHIRLKNIDYRNSLKFIAGSTLGVLLSGGIINYFLDKYKETPVKDDIEKILSYIVFGVIFFSVVFMVRETFFAKKDEVVFKKKSALGFYGVSFLVGIVMGSTGVGGGVLIIPVLFLYLSLKTRITVGSSIFIAVVISFITYLIYSKGGNINVRVALFMTIGSLGGIFLGGKLVTSLSEKVLKSLILLSILICSLLLIGVFFK